MTVKISGTRAIVKALNDFPKEVNKRREVLDPALVAGAVIIRNQARLVVPVDTGVIKRNIIVQRWPKPEGRAAATVVVRVRKLKGAQVARMIARNKRKGVARNTGDPFYWRFVEFGTSKMAARSFLRLAFDVMKQRGVDAAILEMRKRIQEVVERLGKRTLSQRIDTLVLGRHAR